MTYDWQPGDVAMVERSEGKWERGASYANIAAVEVLSEGWTEPDGDDQ